MIAAVEATIEDYLGRKIGKGTHSETRSGLVGRDAWLESPPYVSDLAVTDLDGNAVAMQVVDSGHGWIRRREGKFDPEMPYTFAYTGGYDVASVPEPIRLAALHLIAREWHRLRTDGQGAIVIESESNELGARSRRLNQLGVDNATRLLLDPYRVGRPV